MTFSITGNKTGQSYGTGVTLPEAERFVISNGFGDARTIADTLEHLGIGEKWNSLDAGRGITIARTT